MARRGYHISDPIRRRQVAIALAMREGLHTAREFGLARESGVRDIYGRRPPDKISYQETPVTFGGRVGGHSKIGSLDAADRLATGFIKLPVVQSAISKITGDSVYTVGGQGLAFDFISGAFALELKGNHMTNNSFESRMSRSVHAVGQVGHKAVFDPSFNRKSRWIANSALRGAERDKLVENGIPRLDAQRIVARPEMMGLLTVVHNGSNIGDIWMQTEEVSPSSAPNPRGADNKAVYVGTANLKTRRMWRSKSLVHFDDYGRRRKGAGSQTRRVAQFNEDTEP